MSINGLLVGFFKIKYVPVQSVQNALFALLRTKIAPIFAVRLQHHTAQQKFKMSTDGFDFPAYRKRYAMSAAEPSDYTQTAGIVACDGLGPLVSVAALGRQLYSTVRICVILALLCTVIGVVLMFALCAISAFDSATVGNLLVYMGLWLVPVILLNFSLSLLVFIFMIAKSFEIVYTFIVVCVPALPISGVKFWIVYIGRVHYAGYETRISAMWRLLGHGGSEVRPLAGACCI